MVIIVGMARVCLVSCVHQKQDGPVPAAALYTSDWFEKAHTYAIASADRWLILSAEHGVLAPTDEVFRYERTLIGMNAGDRKAWADKVGSELLKRLAAGDEVTLLAGENYREFLVPTLRAAGFSVSVPMEGLRIGQQLNWLDNPHAQHVERFYELLDDLARKAGGPRHLGKCCGRDKWPDRGVYFFVSRARCDGSNRPGSGSSALARTRSATASRASSGRGYAAIAAP